jgi:hypothetical protein
MSFFSKSLYQDVGRNWRGTGLLYLFILLIIVWVPTMIRMHVGLSRFVDEESPVITQQIPRITIKNGQASTDVATPYFIKDKQGNPVAVIDMTGEYRDLDNTTAFVLLTKTKVFVKNRNQTRIYDLQPVGSFEMDRDWAERFLQILRTWMVPALFPILLILSFIARAIQVLIYAAIGLGFAKLANTSLSYKTLMRLAAVALTPVLLLNLLLEFLPFSIPFWWLLGTLIGLAYLFFAVKSNADSAQTAATPPPYAPPVVS